MATAIELKRVVEERQGSDRSFGFVLTAVYGLIGLYPLVRARWWSLAVAAVFALLALAAPEALHPLNRAWLALGRILHKIVSPLVMGDCVLRRGDADCADYAAARPRPVVTEVAKRPVELLDRTRSAGAAIVRSMKKQF